MSSTEALQPDGDAVLYVIDASDSMRQSGLLARSLDAVCTSIRLIHRQADQHFDSGVLLYGCENPDFSRSKFHQVQVMMRVSDPRVADLKKIMSACSPQLDGIGAPMHSEYSLLSALQQSKLEMARLKPSILRRLVLVTNNDNPGNLREVQKIAHELVSMNVLFVPVFLESTQSFDADKYWSHLVYLPPSMVSTNTSMSIRNTNLTVSLQPCNVDKLDFSELILSKAERKPSLFRGTLDLHSMSIGVVGYKICGKAAPRRSHYYANIDGSIVPLSSSTSYITKDTHEEVDSGLIERKIVIGAHESLPISEQHVSELLNVNSEVHPKIKILKFVHISQSSNALPSTSIFIVPSNYTLENSKPAFASLRRSMIRKEVVAWASYTAKGSQKPPLFGYLYAFSPYGQAPCLKPDTSSGMYFVQQSFQDDIRHAVMPSPTNNEQKQQLIPLIQDLLQRFLLKTGYDPSLFPNPVYSQFYNVLESMALGTPSPPVRDATKPNYKSIAANTADIMLALHTVLDTEIPTEPSTKRPADSDDLYKSAAAGLLDRYSLKELRAIALSMNLSDKGRKPEVVERVKTALLRQAH